MIGNLIDHSGLKFYRRNFEFWDELIFNNYKKSILRGK